MATQSTERRPHPHAAAPSSRADLSPQPDPAYPGDPAMEAFTSRGIQHNRAQQFHLNLSGQEFYKLRAMVETRTMDAAKAEDFLGAREAVLLWEKITAQARAQGF